jgi:hypothetical protein
MSSPPCSEQPVRIAAAGSEDECLAARSVARLLITASTSRRVELVARRYSPGQCSHAPSFRAGARPRPSARGGTAEKKPAPTFLTLRQVEACCSVMSTRCPRPCRSS